MSDIHVLVAADTTETATYLAEDLLPRAGYQTTIADDFDPPPSVDVVVVDVSRLRTSPFALLKAQRRMGCTARALLLAPRLTAEMAAEIFDLGIRDYLQSPVDDVMLIDKLGTFASYVLQEQSQVQARQELQETRETLKRRLEEMNALSRIGRSITSINDVNIILSRITEAGVYLTHADAGAIYLLDESGHLTLQAEKGFGDDEVAMVRQPSADSDVMTVFQTGKPVILSGAEQHKLTTGHLVRALINAPIVVGRRVNGVFAVYRHGTGDFDDADQTTAVTLADFAAIALDKVHTLEDINHQIDVALEASQEVMRHAETMLAPIDGIDSLVETLQSGQFGPLNEKQSTAIERIHLVGIRLREIFGFIQDTLNEFEEQYRDSL